MHFDRLRSGQGDRLALSVFHLDLLRDIQRTNDRLVAAAAYPILSDQGLVLSSRRRDETVSS